MLIKFNVFFSTILCFCYCADWKIDLEFSFDDFSSSNPLGNIELRRNFDGNYTGIFKPTQNKEFGKRLFAAQNSVYSVRAKSSTQPGETFLTTSDPCLFLQSNLFHLFWISINNDRQEVQTITVFPDSVAFKSDEKQLNEENKKSCREKTEHLQPNLEDRITKGSLNGVVTIVGKATLPTPDTVSFVQKLEKEKKAKQHGADTDNRSFLAKYWMYIVPLVVVALISNAVNPEGDGSAAAHFFLIIRFHSLDYFEFGYSYIRRPYNGKEMSNRNYDNIPPHAANTVTISTTPQVRLASGQLRPIGVPLRPQPVSIRKVHHDSGATTSTSTSNVFNSTIKEEVDLDYQGASTSGPLLPSSSTSVNSFQQYQRGTASGQSTSTAHNNGIGTSMDQPAPVNLASKVAEVFLTAGHAFQKLGDLTLQLHTTTDSEESKWSDKEVDSLREALTRFAHELDQISTCVASRTTKHIKNDIKRRHLVDDSNQQVKRMAMTVGNSMAPSGSNATYTTLVKGTTVHTVPLAQKRIGIQPATKVVATRAIVPTRYTIGSSGTINNGSTSGMPLLQQQGGQTGRIAARVAVQPTLVGKLAGGTTSTIQNTKRIIPSKVSSGALVLDSNG